MRFLCLTALSISGYLAWTSFQAGEVFGCSGGALIDCDHVLHSKYAKIFGIPVSVPAVALYATLLSVLFFFRKTSSESLLKAGWMVLTVGAISAAGAALWFIGLQVAEMKFCQYCLVAHFCGLTLATIVMLKNPQDRSTKTGFAGMAMTGVMALVVTQWQSEAPPTFVVETFPEASEEGQSNADSSFSAPGEFAAPGVGGPEEFGAPGMPSGPVEFAPPGFDAPAIATSESGDSDPSAERQDNDQGSQLTSLVPTPIDITQDKPAAEVKAAKPSLKVLEAEKTDPPAASDDTEDGLLPLEAFEGAQPTKASTKLAGAAPRSSVEYTPPMEVPVIFATGESVIQRVDFRTEDDSASTSEKIQADEAATAAPSTSQNSTSSDVSEQAIETAIVQPTGLQVLNSATLPKTTSQAMGYLFFSASGATNAAISEVLLLNSVMLPATSGRASVGQDESGSDDDTMNDAPAKVEPPKKDRLVVVAGNQFSLNPKHWPLIGKPDAEFIFVEMFDYTCPHCRVTHKAIEGAFAEYGDRLAVITLPVPLERACNSTVSGMGSPGACEMAKLAVAVWRIERAKFSDYHHYMCSNQRTAAQARAKAIELVGKEKLDAEMAMPYATDYIKKHVELYRKVGQGSVPKLMFPRSTMTGEIQQSSAVVNAIKRELDN